MKDICWINHEETLCFLVSRLHYGEKVMHDVERN